MPEEKNKIRIIIDVNLWISFAIGKHAEKIRDIVLHPLLEVYASKELLEELKDVLK